MCDCRARIEEKLLARYREQAPEGSGHQVSLQGYAFGITADNELVMRGVMPYTASADYPNKKLPGVRKHKTLKGTMAFTFCPFCGESYEQESATPQTPAGADHG